MTEPIESVTRQALALALDAASLRQQAIAANIANASVDGYLPQRVEFESQLEDVRRSLRQDGRMDPAALAQVRPVLAPMLQADGAPAPVRLDAEAAEMARNAVHYQALLKGLSRHFSILATAVNDGRK